MVVQSNLNDEAIIAEVESPNHLQHEKVYCYFTELLTKLNNGKTTYSPSARDPNLIEARIEVDGRIFVFLEDYVHMKGQIRKTKSEFEEFCQSIDLSSHKWEVHHVYSVPLDQQYIRFDQEIQQSNKILREIEYSPRILHSLLIEENILEVFRTGCNSFIQVFSLHGTDSGNEQYLYIENKYGGTYKLSKDKIDEILSTLVSEGK